MDHFSPIDHKDTDPEYRATVWQNVSSRLNTVLQPVLAAAQLTGSWTVIAARTDKQLYTEEFQDNGVVVRVTRWPAGSQRKEYRYEVRKGVLEIDYEGFHCALSDKGDVIVFNGDGSIVLKYVKADSKIASGQN